jgi:hypothetical protein
LSIAADWPAHLVDDAPRDAGRKRDVKEPSVIVAAMRGAPGLCVMPLIEMRGWRAEKRKPVVSAILLGPRRAPLGAPHALK